MSLIIVLVFLLGYILIAFESALKIDKAATALLTGVICWLVLLFGFESMPVISEIGSTHSGSIPFIHDALFKHLGEISEILFFLLGAMTIVEMVDVHDGFRVIKEQIPTGSRVKLLWIISIITFFCRQASII
jgi:Na+/H+ antiporter NhaD/arsenite permease-like protein